MYKILIYLLTLLIFSNQAYAGSSTITATPGTGATYDVVTDGSGNFVGMFALADGTAAANKAAVNASGQLSITGIVGGLAASGSAVVGNPVRVGGENGSGNVGEGSVSTWGSIPTGLTVFGTNSNVAAWDGTALGAPSAYGTSPGAVAVIGVNAFLTNSPSITGASPPSTTMQNAATGNGNGTVLSVSGYGVALINVTCSACSGGTAVNFEVTDSTGTFFSIEGYPVGGGTPSSAATTTSQWFIPVPALTSLRGRIGSYSAGTVTVTGTIYYGSFSPGNVSASQNGTWTVNPTTIATWGLGATGGTVPTNTQQIGGSDGTDLRVMLMSTTGQPHIICDSGCSGSGGTSITDNAAFTTGTTAETPIGCYAGTPSATANHSTIVACTTAGSVHTTVDNTNANGQATMANSSPVALASNQSVGDPCTFQAKTNVPISTASGTLALVTGVSAKKVYICSLSLIAASAVAVSIAEGSGTTCGTSAQAGIIGVATSGTAADGLSLAANGGLTFGNGGGTVAQSATAANYVCLFQSGTVQIAGNMTYVQQ